jgi:hypothetical protein
MKLLQLLLIFIPLVSVADEFNVDFDKTLIEASSERDLSRMADREEEITRGARALKERRDMGIDFKDGEWKYSRNTEIKNSPATQVSAPAFRFSNESVVEPGLPEVISVANNSVKLKHNGTVKNYSNGDKVGMYHVENISIHSVTLRDNDSREYTLSTDWQ